MDESLKVILDKIQPDRRRFVQRLIGMASFASPAVRTFVMGSAVASVGSDVLLAVNAAPTTPPLHPVRTTATPLIREAGSLLPTQGGLKGSLLPTQGSLKGSLLQAPGNSKRKN